MQALWRIYQFIKFYFKAKTLYNIHSPYLFQLLNKIIDVDKLYYAYKPIEEQRTAYNYDNTPLIINDQGAGSSSSNLNHSVASISKSASSNQKKCRLLYNIVDYYKPKVILELGTNLGIASCYLQIGNKSAQVYTVEADQGLFERSVATFKKLQLPINAYQSLFSEFFSRHSDIVKDAELIYIDGNHTYEGTMQSYTEAKNNKENSKILIFDDIYWSQDMKRAWNTIITSTKSGYTIDLFQLGIVIPKSDVNPPENIKFIPWKYKPFSHGLFG